MGGEYGGMDGEVERRKESIEVGKKLTRIEAILEALKEQLSARFESVKNWQSNRDDECKKLEEDMVKIRIEQAMQGVKVGIGSIVGSAVMAAVVAYFMKK